MLISADHSPGTLKSRLTPVVPFGLKNFALVLVSLGQLGLRWAVIRRAGAATGTVRRAQRGSRTGQSEGTEPEPRRRR